MKLFRFFKGHALAVIVCAIVLVAQACLELSLPNYMSEIVDVGLQQNGISSPVPETIRARSLSFLELFMSKDDAAEVNQAYGEPNAEGIRTYIGGSADAAEGGKLAGIMGLPECAALSIEEQSDGKVTPEDIPFLTDADITKALDALKGTAEANPSLIAQRAIAFVQREYEAQGIDLHELQTNYLMRTAAIMFGLCLGTLITALIAALIASRTAATIARDTRRKLFRKVMSFSPTEVNEFSQASLITRSTNDIQQIQMACVMMMRMAMFSPIMGIVAFIQVTITRSGMEWVIGVAILALFAVLGVLLGTTMPKFKRMQSLVDRLNLVSRDMLNGIMPIRAFGREDYELNRFDDASKTLMNTQLFVNRAMSFMMPLIMLVMNLTSLLIVWIGAQGVNIGSLQVGTMMAFITYAMQIIMSFMFIGMLSVMLPRAAVAAGRVTDVIDCPLSIKNPTNPESPKADAPRGNVVFDNVTFSYPDAKNPVVENVSFQISAGKTLGVIGPTGSGKSTLVQLIPRLYDVTSGSVSVDGVDVRKMSIQDVRSRVGYVFQQGFLFSGTIESNIKFANESMSDAQMERAAQIAQASEFIEKEPERFETPIAQKGTNVSGGQRQRISIARALAAEPEILILDDAFSALDYATDAKLREALKANVEDTAVVIVAQRVATIMQADEILVLEAGKVVGHGTHTELLSSCDTYREIALSQLSAAELGIAEMEATEAKADATTPLVQDGKGGEQ